MLSLTMDLQLRQKFIKTLEVCADITKVKMVKIYISTPNIDLYIEKGKYFQVNPTQKLNIPSSALLEHLLEYGKDKTLYGKQLLDNRIHLIITQKGYVEEQHNIGGSVYHLGISGLFYHLNNFIKKATIGLLKNV